MMTSDDLKEWRKRLNLSLDKAAQELGCSKGTLIAYERGRKIPHYFALACAAYALGVKAIGSYK
ncbi:helix-turn-helix transcriptional regulator [Agrobacterium rhizogenes]|nr:helix-turn-helix transcriptional regulator [Rhizobium rhizogenes]NTJ77377.1 helix-turn-helix transcriptional regulator [Rhizobium rhizogenes]